jgi:hypothetical protein
LKAPAARCRGLRFVYELSKYELLGYGIGGAAGAAFGRRIAHRAFRAFGPADGGVGSCGAIYRTITPGRAEGTGGTELVAGTTCMAQIPRGASHANG